MKLNRLPCLLILLAPSCSAFADDAVQQLAHKLQTMETITAGFKQTIEDIDGQILQQASGTLQVKRPRRFHWQTQTPYEHLVVTDGKLLWLYDIDLEQVSKQLFSADMDKAPALLLSGEVEEISKQYQVTKISAQQFLLTPRTNDSVFKQLSLKFNGALIALMTMKDSLDQTTIIEFSSVKLNKPIADSVFDFVPPDGIDVINNEP